MIRDDFLHAFVDALQPVFLVGAAVTLVAFGLAWLLKEVPLRTTTQAPSDTRDGSGHQALTRIRNRPAARGRTSMRSASSRSAGAECRPPTRRTMIGAEKRHVAPAANTVRPCLPPVPAGV